jgi:hypothetical protein
MRNTDKNTDCKITIQEATRSRNINIACLKICFFNGGTGRLNQKSEGEINDDFRLGFLVPPWDYTVPEYSTQNHELPYPHINRQLSQVVPQGSQRAICNKKKTVLWMPQVYPGILVFSIPDPGSNNNKTEGENSLLSYLFYSHKFHKI